MLKAQKANKGGGVRTSRLFKSQYVCFSCMLSRRRNYTSDCSEVLCSSCHKPMRHLDYRMRIPVKDRKKWNDFEAWLDKDKARFAELNIHEAMKILRK